METHAAHDSLFSQFLSPISNLRDDQWGGPLTNRYRLLLQTLGSIKQSVGPDFPVMVKLGMCDGIDGGLGMEQGLEAERALAGGGADILEMSMGLQGMDWDDTGLKSEKAPEGYYRSWSRALKASVEVPVILTGGIPSLPLG